SPRGTVMGSHVRRVSCHRERSPVLWRCFCHDWLSLSATKTEAWWHALTQARWTRAMQLRTMILCQSALATDWHQVLRLYEGAMSPQELIAVCEALQQEGCLHAGLMRTLTEKVLVQTDAHGQWKGAS